MAPKRRPAAERFWDKVDFLAPGGCWLWTGALSDGYGKFRDGEGRIVRAHRWSWEQTNGPVPDGLQLDHLCRVRACVRPEHAEPVTCRENLLRGDTITAARAAVTACPKGHAYTPANIRKRKDGTRECRECDLARKRKARA